MKTSHTLQCLPCRSILPCQLEDSSVRVSFHAMNIRSSLKDTHTYLLERKAQLYSSNRWRVYSIWDDSHVETNKASFWRTLGFLAEGISMRVLGISNTSCITLWKLGNVCPIAVHLCDHNLSIQWQFVHFTLLSLRNFGPSFSIASFLGKLWRDDHGLRIL
jgi:hypothetical protein